MDEQYCSIYHKIITNGGFYERKNFKSYRRKKH